MRVPPPADHITMYGYGMPPHGGGHMGAPPMPGGGNANLENASLPPSVRYHAVAGACSRRPYTLRVPRARARMCVCVCVPTPAESTAL
ncbi:hypothetical protein EON66_06680, partial [archaeon]